MQNARRGFILLVFVLCPVMALLAQPGDPSTDPDVPITGIEILITIGGFLGIKKLIDKRKKTS